MDPLSDTALILGLTCLDDPALEDLYPREALIEAGLWDEPVPEPERPAVDAPTRRDDAEAIRDKAQALIRHSGWETGVVLTFSRGDQVLWSRWGPSACSVLRASKWPILRHITHDLHLWDIPSLL